MTQVEAQSCGLQELIWTPAMIARFWDFEDTRPQNSFSFSLGAAVVRHVRHYLQRTFRIVDYGAGPGFLVEDLLAGGYQCAAVEFTPEAVRRLTEKISANPNFFGVFHVGETATLEGRIDVVFLVEVVEHLYDPAFSACLASIRSLLSRGGLLIITTPNDEDRSEDFIMSPESGKIFHRWQHVRSWTATSLEEKVCAHGFECVEKGATDFSVSLYTKRRTLSAPVRLVRSVVKWLLQCAQPSLKPPHLYVVARKNS